MSAQPTPSTAAMPAPAARPTFLRLYLWTLSFLKPYRGVVLLVILCDLLLTLLQLAIPYAIGYLIDEALPAQNYAALYAVLAIVGALAAGILGGQALRHIWVRVVSEQPGKDIQHEIFNKLRILGFSYYEQTPTGSILSLMQADVSAMQGLYRDLPKLVQDLLMVAGMTAALFYLDWRLTLAVIPCFGLFYLAEPYLSKQTELWGRTRAERLRRKNQQLYDSVVSLPEVKAHGAEEWNTANLMDKLDAYQVSELKSRKFALIRAAVRNLSITVGAAVLFIFGAHLIRTGLLQTGAFMAFTLIYFIAIGRFTFIFFRIAQLKVSFHQVEKVYLFMSKEPSIQDPLQPVILPSVNGELIMHGVCFDYPSKSKALEGIHLHVRQGERIALVGPSGSGKSTLVKLVARFYDPTAGEILLDGVPIRELSLTQLRDAVGHVFQETFLFAASIRDNIRFARPEASDEEIVEAAKGAYAHDFIVSLTDGYETEVGERGVKLSGGQKQRIAIARLLLKNPAIVVLDEATSALDNNSELEVRRALDALLRGRTTLAIAHRLTTVRDYDRIVFLEDGRIAETGTYEELLNVKGRLYEMSRRIEAEV